MRALRDRIADEGWDSRAIQHEALQHVAHRYGNQADAEVMLHRFMPEDGAARSEAHVRKALPQQNETTRAAVSGPEKAPERAVPEAETGTSTKLASRPGDSSVPHTEDGKSRALDSNDPRDLPKNPEAKATTQANRTTTDSVPRPEAGHSGISDAHNELVNGFYRDLPKEIGWETEGGRIIREADTGGLKPEVVGRTKWIPQQGPFGESPLWTTRPEKGGRITPGQAGQAFAKKNAWGQKMHGVRSCKKCMGSGLENAWGQVLCFAFARKYT